MNTSPYSGSSASLATRHAKEEAIGPVLQESLGLEVVVVDIDTDTYGTFAGEIPRIDTPFNTAVAKARAGMDVSGCRIGLASEGTIGPDPQLPFVTSDIETIVLVDDTRGIAVTETTRSTDVVAVRETVTPQTDLRRLLERAGFPRHGLIVRAAERPEGPIIKGITEPTDLYEAIRECSTDGGQAIIESDFRACYSPSRMDNIRRCAVKLAERLRTLCPECSTPGWGAIAPKRGLPCASCGTQIESAIRSDRAGCPACPAVQEVPRPVSTVDPRWCPLCNP